MKVIEEKKITLLMNRDVNGKLVVCREERGSQSDRERSRRNRQGDRGRKREKNGLSNSNTTK